MSYDFRLERIIDATPEEIWDAMFDPEEQMRWWAASGETTKASADLRPGGKATVEWGSDGCVIRAEQVFLEIDRPNRIKLTETVFEPDSPVYECVLTFTFEPIGDKTRLTLVHTGFPSAEECDKHQRGTGIFIGRLEGYLAKKGARQ